MSQEWLNIQSFFTDQELIGAINDLSIFLKQEAAGVRDAERAGRAKQARRVLKDFLKRLVDVEATGGQEPLLGVDARFQNLADAFAAARQDSTRFHSVLMHDGPDRILPLLDAGASEQRVALLESLNELRRVIQQHQRADATAIFEEQ